MRFGIIKIVLINLIFILFINTNKIKAQAKITVTGVVADEDNLEPISFATVQFSQSLIGQVTNYHGEFYFHISNANYTDTLIISCVGYTPKQIILNVKDSSTFNNLKIYLSKQVIKEHVIIKSKYSRSYLLWRRVVRNKERNNPLTARNHAYDFTNRIEINLNNVSPEVFAKKRILKNFKFLIEQADTSIYGKKVLPFFVSEAVSKNYIQVDPKKSRELIIQQRTHGYKNDNINDLLGNSYQKFNIYDNQINLFNKALVSPFSTYGDLYYNFKILDTQIVNKRRLIHFLFIPKAFVENTFEGDCWIVDSIWAIQKINLRLQENIDINFIKNGNFVQIYEHKDEDSIYYLKKEIFTAEFTFNKEVKTKLDFAVRKISSYDNYNFNNDSIKQELSKNKTDKDVIVLSENETDESVEYWTDVDSNHTDSKELHVNKMVDTLWKIPTFTRIVNLMKILESGYFNIGKFKVGQWFFIGAWNKYTGIRQRVEFANNELLFKNFEFLTFVTINFGNQSLNQGLQLKYIFNRKYWSILTGFYSDDVSTIIPSDDNSIDQARSFLFRLLTHETINNLAAIRLQKIGANYTKIFPKGYGFSTSIQHQIFTPLINIPTNKDLTSPNSLNPFEPNGYEADLSSYTNAFYKIEFIYSHPQKTIVTRYNYRRLQPIYPVYSLEYTQGIKGIFNSEYNYKKIKFNILHTYNHPFIGQINYTIEAAKIFGTVPFVILERPNMNLVRVYKNLDFNTIGANEFFYDQYVRLNFFHNIGKGILRFIPYIKKFNIRQFWAVNSMWGNISADNISLNSVSSYNKKAFFINANRTNKPIIEIGTGIENIFNLLYIGYFWHISPNFERLDQASRNTFIFGLKIQL